MPRGENDYARDVDIGTTVSSEDKTALALQILIDQEIKEEDVKQPEETS